ncbi:MAG: hypothetical protein SWZ49_31105 [Cyanobacteriota bacterium]|nr:hypothetical protein [Cyanobacteriota bacterium]
MLATYAPDDDVKGSFKSIFFKEIFKGTRQATGILKLDSQREKIR